MEEDEDYEGVERKQDKRTLEVLTRAGFIEIPRTFPKLMFKTDGTRTMIYELEGFIEGKESYRQMYDGENKFVRGLIDKE